MTVVSSPYVLETGERDFSKLSCRWFSNEEIMIKNFNIDELILVNHKFVCNYVAKLWSGGPFMSMVDWANSGNKTPILCGWYCGLIKSIYNIDYARFWLEELNIMHQDNLSSSIEIPDPLDVEKAEKQRLEGDDYYDDPREEWRGTHCSGCDCSPCMCSDPW